MKKSALDVSLVSILSMQVCFVDADGKNETAIDAKFHLPDQPAKANGNVRDELRKVLLWVQPFDWPELVDGRPVLSADGLPVLRTLDGTAAIECVIQNNLLAKSFWNAYQTGAIELVQKNSQRSLTSFLAAAAGHSNSTLPSSEASPSALNA